MRLLVDLNIPCPLVAKQKLFSRNSSSHQNKNPLYLNLMAWFRTSVHFIIISFDAVLFVGFIDNVPGFWVQNNSTRRLSDHYKTLPGTFMFVTVPTKAKENIFSAYFQTMLSTAAFQKVSRWSNFKYNIPVRALTAYSWTLRGAGEGEGRGPQCNIVV